VAGCEHAATMVSAIVRAKVRIEVRVTRDDARVDRARWSEAARSREFRTFARGRR
jgi:hypothetical protein